MIKKQLLKKAIPGLTLAAALAFAVPGLAQSYTGGSGWNVTFDAAKKMVSSFHTADMDETISYLQPGDDATFEVSLKNANSATTDWYMTNKVLYSLEDRSPNSATGGGAYTYYLVYSDKNGTETVLFDSDAVGGEGTYLDKDGNVREGLRGSTNALEDYFYLDTLKSGEGGKILLRVALDGETQGNDYQDTLADLQMNFAVELSNDSTTTTTPRSNPGTPASRTRVVKTGDTNMLPYAIAGGIAGVILLLLAIFGARRRKKETAKAGNGRNG